MACYGDPVGPLTLKMPLMASGKIAMARGVSDSTTFFGFYNSRESMRQNDSQSDTVPESAVGIQIEGPSRDGFRFYPVLHPKGGTSKVAPVHDFPMIHPDGKSHDWKLEFEPDATAGRSRITVALDGRSSTFDVEPGATGHGTTFDRFGIVSSWIDGNSQDVYWDDIVYTQSQQ
jgi:hypothetical protein